MKLKKCSNNYSSNESQKLFREFAVTLGQITARIEEKERHVQTMEYELGKYSRLKYLLKMVYTKIKNKFIIQK